METPSVNAKVKDYSVFNKFQTLFYTDIAEFDRYTNYEIKQNAVTLLINIQKGFPHLADEILNLYSPAVKALESPAILKALQRVKFINSFGRRQVPQFIYYKQSTKKAKVEVDKGKKLPANAITEFASGMRTEIMNILQYDSKDFEYFKFSEKVQNLARQINGEMIQKEEMKKASLKKAKKT